MAIQSTCPSCGAPVVFQSAASIFAVCAYCSSTLVRHDQVLEDIGKMAALVEDRSPLRLGSEGRWQGVHFALIGRIQIKYKQGYWNEWHLLFDDLRNGWLSEAGGEYVLSFSHPIQEPLPAFADLVPAQRLMVDGRAWTVCDIETAECVAGEGELPFKVGAGYALPTVDLRSSSAHADNFATLDYSETPPLYFVGQSVEFKTLSLSNLREGMGAPEKKVAASVFRCPACGVPMTARSVEIRSVGCASCGAVVDTSDTRYQLLSRALDLDTRRDKPWLPLGSKGVLNGEALEVIGFLVQRSVIDGANYEWHEYFLAAPQGRYVWLTEYHGHWSVARVLAKPPVTGAYERDAVRLEHEVFRHFSTSPVVEVVQVAGEFTWRVARGDRCGVIDYIAPPRMLSREMSGNEVSWTLAEYVEAAAIERAFAPPAALPQRWGVAPNQPNPWQPRRREVWSQAWRFLLLAVALQTFFVMAFPGRTVLEQQFQLQPQSADQTVLSNEFRLPARVHKLTLKTEAQLNNSWLALDYALINKDTGQAWPASRELSFYSGVDSDGSWSEGSPSDAVVFNNVPAGNYFLTLEPTLAPEQLASLPTRIDLVSGGVSWLSFFILLAVLLAFPVLAHFRLTAFEGARWQDSDHPPENTQEDDD